MASGDAFVVSIAAIVRQKAAAWYHELLKMIDLYEHRYPWEKGAAATFLNTPPIVAT